tara:strand:+ start:212 stop:487 length:276 start_codon:yes stop_codon:yes gene_type:complete
MIILILGRNIYAATNIELIEAINTDAAAQSLQIFANLLKLFPTTRSTRDSIEVFNISKIKTENIVATMTIFSKLFNLRSKLINNVITAQKI